MSMNAKLVDAEGLLRALFDEDSRPTVTWVRALQRQKQIPFFKIGHLVRFDVEKVREALGRRHERKARV